MLSIRFSTSSLFSSSDLGLSAMALHSISEEYADVLAQVGILVVYWNRVEEAARLLVRHFNRGDRDRSDILTAHMGTNSLCDALRTLSSAYCKSHEQEHIRHYIKLLERVREYRNYYIHGLLGYEEGMGQIQTLSARSNLILHAESVDAEDIENIAIRCLEVSRYGINLYERLRQRESARKQKKRLPPLPDKPPLPNKLRKPQRALLGT